MLPRVKKEDRTYLVGYHTQEYRINERAMEQPGICTKKNAWLGVGYYFWTDLEFAHFWGKDSKTRTGAYDIYESWILDDDLLNAVFSEEQYFFLREKIEQTINHFKELGITNVELHKVHKYLSENIWLESGVKGIIFDDIPQNSKDGLRTYTEIPPLHYKKRIQIVVFNMENIHRFDLYLENQEV